MSDTQQQKSQQTPRAESSWGPKLFVATLSGLLLFFWWLLIYSGGVVLHH